MATILEQLDGPAKAMGIATADLLAIVKRGQILGFGALVLTLATIVTLRGRPGGYRPAFRLQYHATARTCADMLY